MIIVWIKEAWNRVAIDERILNGFRQCGYIGYHGNIDKLHSKLRDTNKNREVPYEAIVEVDAFIAEMKLLDDEEVRAADCTDEELDEIDECEIDERIETDKSDDSQIDVYLPYLPYLTLPT